MVGGTTVGTAVVVDGLVIDTNIPPPNMCGLWFLSSQIFLVNCSNYPAEPAKGAPFISPLRSISLYRYLCPFSKGPPMFSFRFSLFISTFLSLWGGNSNFYVNSCQIELLNLPLQHIFKHHSASQHSLESKCQFPYSEDTGSRL